MDQYFGTYESFDTPSKKDAAVLLGADNLVGDKYRVDIELANGEHRAWLVNRFDKRIGFFDASFSRKLSILQARDFEITALLSFVAYTDHPDPGYYWGEMAVIGYDKRNKEAFDVYVEKVGASMAEGKRPNVDLGEDDVDRVVDSKGEWVSDSMVPLPAKAKGTAIMKSKRSLNERMIEQGRKGNIGCYIVSWAFIFALVALAVFGLKSCGVF